MDILNFSVDFGTEEKCKTHNTDVNSKTGQCLRNHTVINAHGYKSLVQSGEAKIGLLHLSNRYYRFHSVHQQ